MIRLADYNGKFLPADGETCFHTLDGSDVANWLRSIGEQVVDNHDTGRCGIAITVSGYRVSTNGYVHKLKANN